MVIDIVEYTEEQLAALPKASLQKVRDAQMKKDKLLAELDEKILEEKGRLIDRGTFPSNIWAKKQEELSAKYEREVEATREALLFYLHYAGGNEEAPDDVDYPVDFALSETERMTQVRAYYLSKYTDATARFNAFAGDRFARTYLGELYAPLYDYFQSLI